MIHAINILILVCLILAPIAAFFGQWDKASTMVGFTILFTLIRSGI